MQRIAVLALAVLAAACQPAAETPEQATARMQAESDSARTAIDAINVAYARYINGNMADSVASLFMETGVMMAPNAPAATGRQAIAAAMGAQQMPPGSNMAFQTVSVSANGPIAVEHGTYTFTMPAQGRTPAVTETGKYLVHWHKVNGTWLQAATIWNSDVPVQQGS